MPEYTPVKEVISLARQGYNDETIIRKLKEEGFSPRQINDAFNQVKIKSAAGADSEEMEPSIMSSGAGARADSYGDDMMAPAPSSDAGSGYGYEETPSETEEGFSYPQTVQYPAYESRPSTEVIEEIAEEIINEKWRDFKTRAGDFGALKKFFEERLKNLALRMKKIENYMDKINNSVVVRIRQYESELKILRAETRALETAFSKILEPLVTNVRKFQEGEAGKELKRLKSKKREEEKLESKLSRKRK